MMEACGEDGAWRVLESPKDLQGDRNDPLGNEIGSNASKKLRIEEDIDESLLQSPLQKLSESVQCSPSLISRSMTHATDEGAEDGRDTVLIAPAYAQRFTAAATATRTPNFRVHIDVGSMPQGANTQPSEIPESPTSARTLPRGGSRQSRDSQMSAASKARRKRRSKVENAMSSASVEVSSLSARAEGDSNIKERRNSEQSSVNADLLEDFSDDADSDISTTSVDWYGNENNGASRHTKYVISDGTDYHHITKSRSMLQALAIAERRTALVSGLDFVPFYEQDPTFLNFESIVREEARCVQRPQLKRARAHYKKMVERFPTNYVALVNLACCHALLADYHKALPFLGRAIERSPEKGPAHVNRVLCLVKLQDYAAALAAIEHTFNPSSAKVAELSKSQRSLLLRCKAAIFFRSQGDSHRAMQMCCEAAVAAAVEDPLDAPHETRCGGAAIVTREGNIVGEGYLRAELRDGIQNLKISQEDEYPKPQKPPWGRRHVFGCDETKYDLAGQQGMHKWCHLRPDQIDELRKHLKQPLLRHLYPRGQFQARTNLPMDRGAAAYETARMLTFFNRLEPQHAIAILNLAELLEMMPDEYVFKQGDVADFMYVIAMGSVHIVVTDPTYGPYPVIIDTFYDGQSFGESAYAEDADVSFRRASVVAQEPCVLLRFRPSDYRSVIAAAVVENFHYDQESAYGKANTVGSSDEPSAELLLHKGDALERRMDKLRGVPCFEPCSEHQLMLLASNAQEICLRYGDEIVRSGDTPRGCFVINEGFCKVFVNGDADHRAGAQPSIAREYTSIDNGSANGDCSRSLSKTRIKDICKPETPSGSAAVAVRLRGGTFTRPGSQVTASPAQIRAPTTKQSKPKLSGRTPGTPRARTPWAESLRGGKVSFCMGNRVAKEVDLGYLSPGQAFGLGAMFDFSERASATVQVDSDVAKVLVLTQRSLLYLPDTLVTTVMEKSKDMVDPARPTIADIRVARKQQLNWAAEKRKMLTEEMTTRV